MQRVSRIALLLPLFAQAQGTPAPSPVAAEDSSVRAEQQPGSPRPGNSQTNPPIRTIAPGILEIGLVQLDQERRAISIPSFVNLREGVLEYVLVHSNGKTHESLLRTDAEPHHVHVAMLLLGARGAGTNALPPDPAQPLPGDKVTVELVWKRKGKEIRERAESFVRDRKRKAALKKGDWAYTGSRLREDGFAAQMDGSIVSLITDPDALVNNPRPGRDDDDTWLARPGKLPAFNEPVQVVITIQRPSKP